MAYRKTMTYTIIKQYQNGSGEYVIRRHVNWYEAKKWEKIDGYILVPEQKFKITHIERLSQIEKKSE